MTCPCSLCETRRLSEQQGREVHPWEVMYGMKSPAAGYVRQYPGRLIQFYDSMKRAHEYHGREVTPDEAAALTIGEYDRWDRAQPKAPRPPIIVCHPDGRQIAFASNDQVKQYLDDQRRTA